MKRRLDNRWTRNAAAVANRIPWERLHPAVQRWAGGRSEVVRGPWAVAFSGGADSLCLLLLLRAHRPRHRMVALHFNHRLRGAESDGDEVFCRKVSAALGVAFQRGRWHRPRRAVGEAAARAARFAFFERAMLRTGARALWLGHQQNDIAETMLMRLARGSGSAGLAAPRPVMAVGGRVHLRPLLTIKKEEVVAVLRGVGAPWREDRSNAAREFFRNRVRQSVLPAWQSAAGRDALAGAALSREMLEEDDEALAVWLKEFRPFQRGALHLGCLVGRPRALMRRALRQWLADQPLAGELSRQGFDDLLAAVTTGKPVRRSLGVNGFAVVRNGRLRFERVRPRKHGKE